MKTTATRYNKYVPKSSLNKFDKKKIIITKNKNNLNLVGFPEI